MKGKTASFLGFLQWLVSLQDIGIIQTLFDLDSPELSLERGSPSRYHVGGRTPSARSREAPSHSMRRSPMWLDSHPAYALESSAWQPQQRAVSWTPHASRIVHYSFSRPSQLTTRSCRDGKEEAWSPRSRRDPCSTMVLLL